MNPEDTLQAELLKQLDELKTAAEPFRNAELEDRRERFEMPIGEFDNAWLERLNQEELAELRGANIAANKAALQPELDSQAARNEADRQVLPALGRDEREYLWRAENRRELAPSKETNERAAEIYEASRQVIQQQYSELRLVLEQGIQAIEQGRDPTLTEVLSQKVEQASETQEAMFSLSAYRRLAEAKPEAAQELSRLLQPKQTQEQENQR